MSIYDVRNGESDNDSKHISNIDSPSRKYHDVQNQSKNFEELSVQVESNDSDLGEQSKGSRDKAFTDSDPLNDGFSDSPRRQINCASISRRSIKSLRV